MGLSDERVGLSDERVGLSDKRHLQGAARAGREHRHVSGRVAVILRGWRERTTKGSSPRLWLRARVPKMTGRPGASICTVRSKSSSLRSVRTALNSRSEKAMATPFGGVEGSRWYSCSSDGWRRALVLTRRSAPSSGSALASTSFCRVRASAAATKPTSLMVGGKFLR